jgi:hypothetical protein
LDTSHKLSSRRDNVVFLPFSFLVFVTGSMVGMRNLLMGMHCTPRTIMTMQFEITYYPGQGGRRGRDIFHMRRRGKAIILFGRGQTKIPSKRDDF